MVNFMKFHEVAAYDTGEEAICIEALMRYQEVANQKVEGVGGEFVATGLFGGIHIGEGEEWDAIGVVRYPNKEAFIQVFCDLEYRDIHRHRVASTLRHCMAYIMRIAMQLIAAPFTSLIVFSTIEPRNNMSQYDNNGKCFKLEAGFTLNCDVMLGLS